MTRTSLEVWSSRVLLIIAAGLLGFAGYLALQSSDQPSPAFIVEECDRDLGERPSGAHTLSYRVTNPADRPRRIIGLAEA